MTKLSILPGVRGIPYKMKAALYYGPEEVRIENTDVPEIGSGEVLVRVGAALTCGTDFKTFRRGHPLLIKNIPSPFGHEMSGTIVKVGDEVSGFTPGMRVVAANSAPCGQCFFCRRSQHNLCENLEFLNGAFAEFIRIPEKIVNCNLYRVPQTLSFREAALSEPLACVIHCLDKLRITPGEVMCIIGSGPLSLLMIQVAKLHQAKVIVVGRSHDKLEAAEDMGADCVINVRLAKDPVAEIKAVCHHGYGADLVIEAVGSKATWNQALGVVRKGGRICLFGGCPQGTVFEADAYRIHYEQISVHGVFHYTPDYFVKALGMLAEGKIQVNPLITHECRLSELNQIFIPGVLHNPLKVVVIP